MESSWTSDSPLFFHCFSLDTAMSRPDLPDPFLQRLTTDFTSLLSAAEAYKQPEFIIMLLIQSCEIDNPAETNWFAPPIFSQSLRQKKGDVGGCWSCLSDMFSLIPSPRVVPRWPALKKTASRARGEAATRKRELRTAAEWVHVRILITAGAPQHEEASHRKTHRVLKPAAVKLVKVSLNYF